MKLFKVTLFHFHTILLHTRSYFDRDYSSHEAFTCLPGGFVGFVGGLVGAVGMTTGHTQKKHTLIHESNNIETVQYLTNSRRVATQTFTETLLLFAANLLAIHGVVIHLYTGDLSAEFTSITGFASYYNGVVRGKTTPEATQSALDDGKTVEPEASQACSPIVSCSNVVPLTRLYSFVQRFHRFS